MTRYPITRSDGVRQTNVPVDVIKSLCSKHRESAFAWRNLTYSVHNPSEWPGGQLIVDNRTSHAERHADWARKSQEQIVLIVNICQSGKSCSSDNHN